jgi:hypothetical protein
VHCATTLALLLVVNIQSEGLGGSKLGEQHSVGQHYSVLSECDVLHTELDGPSVNGVPWHGIFANLQQQEECDGDQASCGTIEHSVRCL